MRVHVRVREPAWDWGSGEEKSPKLVEVLRSFKVMLSVPEVSPLPLSAGLLAGPGVHQILTARL